MATTSPEALKYQTWVLKVSIHCEGCKRKVKKLLHSIEGVYTVEIDSKQQKAIVTGNVAAETLIKKLVRNGKPAEMMPENPTGKQKKSGKGKNGEKGKESDSSDDSSEEEDNGGVKLTTTKNGSSSENNKSGENIGAAAANNGGGESGNKKKKKKKKKKKGGNNNSGSAGAASNGGPETSKMGSIDLGPPNQVPYPPSYMPHQVYVVSYNAANPLSGPSHYVPQSPYTYTYAQPDYYYPVQSTPLDSLQILSDENPHACYVM